MATTPNIDTRSLLNVLGDNNPDSNTIGRTGTDKAGMHGAAAVQAALVAAVDTTGATNSSPYGYTTAAQANDLVTLVNAMRTALINHGIMAAS